MYDLFCAKFPTCAKSVYKSYLKIFQEHPWTSLEVVQQNDNNCRGKPNGRQCVLHNVQESFYLCQLNYKVFGVHNFQRNHGMFYTYQENQARTGPNEVASYLMDYINSEVSDDFKHSHLLSDSCAGQNRNPTCNVSKCNVVAVVNILTTSIRIIPIYFLISSYRHNK